MASYKDRLDHLRIASPCPANWEQMSGDDRVRFCGLCSLRVYNVSQMTRKETEALIAPTEGRICARLYRRSDGTIITKRLPGWFARHPTSHRESCRCGIRYDGEPGSDSGRTKANPDVTAILIPKRAVETIGVTASAEPLETTTTILNGDLIRRLPH